jgi:acyl-CoA reductase-like NAD-dependent aldehyde dehydrogenase
VTRLLINGRWVPSESSKNFAAVNPTTGEEICRVAEADQGHWRKTTTSERGRLLQHLADLIETRSDKTGPARNHWQRQALNRSQDRGCCKDRCLPLLRRMG